MNEKDETVIKFQSKYSQNCKSCSKVISLNEKFTFLCSKCKFYFCEECALFFNENSSNAQNNCPGGENNDPHDSIMVKITRNIKEYMPIGVSIDQLERKQDIKTQQSTMKIIDNDNSEPPKKSKLKILDD